MKSLVISTNSTMTRRSAVGLAIAGLTLPAANADSRGKLLNVYTIILTNTTLVELTTCSGETLTARFTCDLKIGSEGSIRGLVRFEFGSEVVELVGEVGGLDLDTAGKPIRAWALLRKRRATGKVAQDFMMLSIAPTASEDCLIYTTTGTQVNLAEPARFDVPGTWQLARLRG